MRVVVDTNLWSSMDDGSLPRFNELLDEWDLSVQVLPSTLLEIVDIPHEHVRKAEDVKAGETVRFRRSV